MTEKSRSTIKRCSWPGSDDLYVRYHDEEWGVPEWSDRALFEKLILDGFQAGLSWITILRKREEFRSAFDGFDPRKIARYNERKIEKLLANPGIIRHRGKIEATIGNAKSWIQIMEKEGGFSPFLWDFVDGRPKTNKWRSMKEVPTETEVSKKMSKALKQKGFKFCGPTIVYAFMQAVGMVNDHTVACFRHKECQKLA